MTGDIHQFDPLVQAAAAVQGDRQLSQSSWAGSVAAALQTSSGTIYTGVCIDTPCSMGFCAEHAAAAAMICAGENRVVRMAAVTDGGQVVPPCGRCREFICQLHADNEQCQVLLPDGQVRTLAELLPCRWVPKDGGETADS